MLISRQHDMTGNAKKVMQKIEFTYIPISFLLIHCNLDAIRGERREEMCPANRHSANDKHAEGIGLTNAGFPPLLFRCSDGFRPSRYVI